MRFIVLDFETYWDSRQYTLSKMGPTEYIRDPRFEAQLLAIVDYQDGASIVCDTPNKMDAAMKLLNESVLIGHNLAGFDALILSERYGLHPRHMWDTIAMMNWTGVSRVIRKTHEALTEFFGHGVKKAGTVVSNGKHWPKDFTMNEQEFFEQYCLDDAKQCAANAKAMIPYMTADALQFMSITARMATEPVFVLDEALLEDYIAEIDSSVAKARSDIMSSFRFPDETAFLQAVRSAPRFAAMLASLGVTPPMKESEAKTKTKRDQLEYLYEQARSDEAKEQIRQRMEKELPVKTYAFSKQDLDFLALREHPDPLVQLLVETRLEHNSSINRSRAERFLTFARHHKPVPIMLSAFNAHTSRYTAGSADESASSDRLQFQNLSKRDPAKARLRQAIKAPEGYKVVACDSSQVEARCLAWVANELELVAQFREGRDPYSELAEVIFGVPSDEIKYGAKHGDKRLKTYRNVGKTAILSCLAGTVEVLTNTGWKRIDTVSVNDKVWDGVSWVNHEGLIYNGVRNTINVGGISMTPDHLIFDGSSWRTAAELLDEPQYLRLAKQWASAVFKIAQSRPKLTSAAFGIKRLVSIAERLVGTMDTLCQKEKLRSFARIVLREIRHILKGKDRSEERQRTLTLVPSLANLLYWQMKEDSMRTDDGSIVRLCNVVAEPSLIGCCNLTYVMDTPHVVMPVQKRKHGLHKIKSIGSMLKSCLTSQHGVDFLGGFQPVSQGAVQQRINVKRGNIMEDEESVWISPTEKHSWSISQPCRGMMTRCLNWIESTVTVIMRRAIFVLSLVQRIWQTSDMLETYNGSSTSSPTTSNSCNGVSAPCSTSWQKVYDLKNCGPNNRFLIRQGATLLMAHNCGYGVGAQKFSDTLLRSGAALSDDIEKHNELAFHAHAVYRAAHPNIVRFWRTCSAVIDALLQGYSGKFGGPNNDLFEYGMMSVCGRMDVPSIKLPSGFIIRYPNLRCECIDGKNVYMYDMPKGKSTVRTKLYSGALCNNINQGFAFQILMWQACRMDSAGVPLAANIHDSFAAVVPAKYADETAQLMLKWMSTVPPWAIGLPVAAEAEIGDSFEVV